MNETVLTIEDAARSLPDIVERVFTNGGTAILMRSGTPVARIVPFLNHGDATKELITFLRNWRNEHPEPDEQFADAIEQSRRGVKPPHDPWE